MKVLRPPVYLAILAALTICTSLLAQVSDTGTVTVDVDTGGASVGSEFYGSGNDDAFAEYGVTSFNFTSADFGGALTAISSAQLTLLVNDRSFSDGDMVELFFTPDTGADLDSGATGTDFADLSYDAAFAPSGINPAHFQTAPVSLGVFAIPEMAGRAGGETDTFSLGLGGGVEAALISNINAGSDFQIMIAATQDPHDITYSGVGNTFDPGDPVLTITATVVPEPAAMGLLLIGLLPLAWRRR